MDTSALKVALKNALMEFAHDFDNEGRTLDYLGFAPLYPDIPSTSYVVQVHGEWIETLPNRHEALEIFLHKLYNIVPPNILRFINRINICYTNGDVHCTAGNTLINKHGFEVLASLYMFTEQ
jgi:hypothetical protein